MSRRRSGGRFASRRHGGGRFAAACLAMAALAPVAAEELPHNPRYLPEAQQEAWAERLADAQHTLDEARERVDHFERAYARSRHEQYPRGEERAEIEGQLAQARRDLEEAERALPRLVEEARRAGVYPSVLRPYQD